MKNIYIGYLTTLVLTGLLLGCNSGSSTSPANNPNAPSALLSTPIGVATDSTYVYITNRNSNSYTQCKLGANGIDSTSCKTVTPANSQGVALLFKPYGIAITENKKYVYITNYESAPPSNTGSYTQCTLGSNGIDPTTCNTVRPTATGTNTPLLSNPIAIGINGGYLYIGNTGQEATPVINSYTQCTLDENAGRVTSCTNVSNTPTIGLNFPSGITFKGSFAYFTNEAPTEDGTSYTKCQINGTSGVIDPNTCQAIIPRDVSTPQPLLNGPSGMLFGNGIVDITNVANDSYIECPVDSTGILANQCTLFNVPAFKGPEGITIQS